MKCTKCNWTIVDNKCGCWPLARPRQNQPESGNCPQCGCMCYRDEVDIGVGVQYGPWLCPQCGWNHDDAIDKLLARKQPPHGSFDGAEQGGPGGA